MSDEIDDDVLAEVDRRLNTLQRSVSEMSRNTELDAKNGEIQFLRQKLNQVQNELCVLKQRQLTETQNLKNEMQSQIDEITKNYMNLREENLFLNSPHKPRPKPKQQLCSLEMRSLKKIIQVAPNLVLEAINQKNIFDELSLLLQKDLTDDSLLAVLNLLRIQSFESLKMLMQSAIYAIQQNNHTLVESILSVCLSKNSSCELDYDVLSKYICNAPDGVLYCILEWQKTQSTHDLNFLHLLWGRLIHAKRKLKIAIISLFCFVLNKNPDLIHSFLASQPILHCLLTLFKQSVIKNDYFLDVLCSFFLVINTQLLFVSQSFFAYVKLSNMQLLFLESLKILQTSKKPLVQRFISTMDVPRLEEW